eukprot:PITA_15591
MPPTSNMISLLPDDLLCPILSRIPVKEAIRCSILSKRWRFLYTQIFQITLSPYPLLGPVTPDPLSIAKVENIISNILLLHSSDLEAFHLSDDISELDHGIDRQWRFNRPSISKWVQYAARKNVQRLTLRDSPVSEIPPPALFSCNFLTELTLFHYNLSHLPTDFSGFSHLITCNLHNIEITDDSLACFISLCPLLQNLKLKGCKGLWKPVISAPNVIHLDVDNVIHLDVDYEMEILTVNCPKLITMKAFMIEDLRANGVLFHEFSYFVSDLKMQQPGSNLIKLSMELCQRESNDFSAERFLGIVGSFKTLKELEIGVGSVEGELEIGVPFYKLLQRLPNLEGLEIRGTSIRELVRDQAPSHLSSLLVNLQIIGVDLVELDENEIAVLGCLLQSTPALKIMDFSLPEEYWETQYTKFLERILEFRRASTQARICKDWLYRSAPAQRYSLL